MEKPKLTSKHINFYALSQGSLTMASAGTTQYVMMFCTDVQIYVPYEIITI